ncbi:hypothetical protein [Streptomyces sp. WZ-12]|uniref:hypothetical protein n=1 Tax=Streptomyces sp. WZ-12 TaxID=3030210 RepID=UPI0023816F1E|nr:hypothetical protein [Streptomyces sp. WZ-12]
MTSKSARVAKVVDHHGNPVYRRMLQQNPWPFVEPLRCAGCTRPVSIVATHLRRGTPVAAHFRLHEGHDANCPLNPTTIIEEIARGSHGLATAGADGTLRLTIPAQDTSVSTPEASGVEAEDEESRAALRITTVRPWLPPALNSAVKVAQFLQRCDFDSEIAELFTVTYQRSPIPWTRFCYGPDDLSYAQLHKRVAATQSKRLKHPVAVHGTVLRTGTSGNKSFAVLATNIPPASGGRMIEVVLRSAYPSLLDGLEVGMQVLAVGAGWKLFAPPHRTIDEVQLWVTQHWNLAYWTWDQDTGHAGSPMCPPPLPPQEHRPQDTQRPAARRANSSHTGGRGKPPRAVKGSQTMRRTPAPRRAPTPRQGNKPLGQPPKEPAAPSSQDASSDDLARLTWQAYTKPASNLPNELKQPAPAHPLTPAEPTPPVPKPISPPAEGRSQLPVNRPPSATSDAPLPPRPAHPPAAGAPVEPTSPPASAPQPEQPTPVTRTGIRGLFTRWRRKR